MLQCSVHGSGRPAGLVKILVNYGGSAVGSKVLEIHFFLLENLSAYSDPYFSYMSSLQDITF